MANIVLSVLQEGLKVEIWQPDSNLQRNRKSAELESNNRHFEKLRNFSTGQKRNYEEEAINH